MEWLTPLVGAIAAAAAVPTLVLLYFLKLKRQDVPVSSTLLWKRAVQDLQVNAPFQRLRKNLLLFLQLLVLAAAILALARPIIRTAVADEERVVLLIDRSASMNAREGEQTRLDAAKEQAIRKSSGELNSVRSNDAYKALLTQIDDAKKSKSEWEDKVPDIVKAAGLSPADKVAIGG